MLLDDTYIPMVCLKSSLVIDKDLVFPKGVHMSLLSFPDITWAFLEKTQPPLSVSYCL